MDQSRNPQPSGSAKVLVELHITLMTTTGETDSIVLKTDESWSAFNADVVYQPAGNSGSSDWYWYPQENIDASAIPMGTPLSPTETQKKTNASGRHHQAWVSAVVQASFPVLLVVKPTSAVGVRQQTAVAVREIAPGHFFFDMGKDIQAGVRLTVVLPRALSIGHTSVRLRVAEELDPKTGMLFWPPRTGLHPEVRDTLHDARSQNTLIVHL